MLVTYHGPGFTKFNPKYKKWVDNCYIKKRQEKTYVYI